MAIGYAGLAKSKTLHLPGGSADISQSAHETPWETDAQIRKTLWTHVLKKAGVRYRNPYQTRHTFASTLLSRGENAWWLSQQMGHVDVEMIFRNYGKWIPDTSKQNGYKPVGNYTDFESNDTVMTRKNDILLQVNDK